MKEFAHTFSCAYIIIEFITSCSAHGNFNQLHVVYIMITLTNPP